MSSVLIEAVELTALVTAGAAPLLADVRYTLGGPPGSGAFEQGHLPGAAWVDLDHELSGPPGVGGRHPLPDLATFTAAMQRLGVEADEPVVVYDAATSLAASRLWWLLTDAGHTGVRVLNGGLAAWVGAGGAVETGPGRPRTRGTFIPRPGQRSRMDAATIMTRLERGEPVTLVDVRAAERFRGETEPIDPVAGHIPSAVSRPGTANQDDNSRFRPELVRTAYAGLEQPVLYCGSGITAAQSLLALEAAGRQDAVIYPGSWSDWITDPLRPVATGSEP